MSLMKPFISGCVQCHHASNALHSADNATFWVFLILDSTTRTEARENEKIISDRKYQKNRQRFIFFYYYHFIFLLLLIDIDEHSYNNATNCILNQFKIVHLISPCMFIFSDKKCIGIYFNVSIYT